MGLLMGPSQLRMFCEGQMAWGQGSDPSMQYSRVVLWSWEMLGQVLPPNSPALTELGFQILAHNLQGSVASQDVPLLLGTALPEEPKVLSNPKHSRIL